MAEKVGFFEEAPGVKSSTRLYSGVMLLFFIAWNMMWISKGKEITDSFIILDLIFLLAIFAPKYLQKIAEQKIKLNGNGKN